MPCIARDSRLKSPLGDVAMKKLIPKSRLMLVIVTTAVIIPAVVIAGSVLVPPATVSGNTTSTSFQATNTGTGAAIYANSKSTTGLKSTLTAVNTSSTAGSAIVGYSSGNTIQGTSNLADGVVGATKNSNSSVMHAGVSGLDLSTISKNAGVFGSSKNGTGVNGTSATGIGIQGASIDGLGVQGMSTNFPGAEVIGGGVIGLFDHVYPAL